MLSMMIDHIDRDPSLTNRETVKHVLTLMSMCAIVPVPDGCSWDPKSVGKLEIALKGVLTLISKSLVCPVQGIQRYRDLPNVIDDIENVQVAHVCR